jgi:hypothetical protein
VIFKVRYIICIISQHAGEYNQPVLVSHHVTLVPVPAIYATVTRHAPSYSPAAKGLLYSTNKSNESSICACGVDFKSLFHLNVSAKLFRAVIDVSFGCDDVKKSSRRANLHGISPHMMKIRRNYEAFHIESHHVAQVVKTSVRRKQCMCRYQHILSRVIIRVFYKAQRRALHFIANFLKKHGERCRVIGKNVRIGRRTKCIDRIWICTILKQQLHTLRVHCLCGKM